MQEKGAAGGQDSRRRGRPGLRDLGGPGVNSPRHDRDRSQNREVSEGRERFHLLQECGFEGERKDTGRGGAGVELRRLRGF